MENGVKGDKRSGMPTDKQKLGTFGEKMVVKYSNCPKCKKENTLKCLPPNFKCADIVCDFCGYLGQVKTTTVRSIDTLPSRVIGAAWGPQQKRMNAGIFFPLFLVLVKEKTFAIYYLTADLQTLDMFVPRKPLSKDAKRAGWQGFYYDLKKLPEHAMVRIK